METLLYLPSCFTNTQLLRELWFPAGAKDCSWKEKKVNFALSFQVHLFYQKKTSGGDNAVESKCTSQY